jgi:hypothetical protein
LSYVFANRNNSKIVTQIGIGLATHFIAGHLIVRFEENLQEAAMQGELSHPSLRQTWRGFVIRVGKKLRKKINRVLIPYSTVGNPPVFDPGVFSWTADLEAEWQAIEAEARAVMQKRETVPPLGDISPDHAGLTQGNNNWRCFFIWGYGYKVPGNAAQCPRTTALVEQIPGLKSAFFFDSHARRLHSLPPRGDIRNDHLPPCSHRAERARKMQDPG